MHLLYGRKQKTILIIEDDQKVALGLAIRIKAAGYEAIMAHDALSGVRSAIKNKPDLVLLDISMPAGNGFIVAERIHRNIPNRIPIIFLTASRHPEFRQKAEELGALAFFEKPYEPTELLSIVSEALG
jgi:DNA-binding response OmpR family regulator